MESFFNAVSAVVVLFALMAVGYFLGVLGWMTPAEKKFVSRYVVNIAVPLNCVIGLLNNFSHDSLVEAGWLILTAMAGILSTLAISALVILLARPLMLLFVQPHETQILAHGVTYLRIEGAFYWGIGCLFLLYGFFRAVKQPAVSVLLTCVSLGLRVALAYLLAGPVGVTGIWASIPIGWVLADATGLLFYRRWKRQTCPPAPPSQP